MLMVAKGGEGVRKMVLTKHRVFLPISNSSRAFKKKMMIKTAGNKLTPKVFCFLQLHIRKRGLNHWTCHVQSLHEVHQVRGHS